MEGVIDRIRRCQKPCIRARLYMRQVISHFETYPSAEGDLQILARVNAMFSILSQCTKKL